LKNILLIACGNHDQKVYLKSMTASKKYAFLVILLIVFSSVVLAQSSAPQITRVSTQGDGSILLTWTIGSEDDVDHYEIYRSTTIDGTFSQVGYVTKGTLSFVDKTDLFKNASKYFCYKVVAVGSNGSLTSNIMGTSYNSPSSTAKRTWGSIKAMFR
jgi:hypothetical protein